MCGLGAGDELSSSLIVSCWSFPLWPLTIKEPRKKLQDLEELREERARTVEWIQESEAKRNPPPAISRSKVKALGDAYANWERDVDVGITDRAGGNEGGLRIRSSADIEKDFELPSYARVENMFQELTEEERAALLALGWFAREQVANWPRIYERAWVQASTLNDAYQISYGSSKVSRSPRLRWATSGGGPPSRWCRGRGSVTRARLERSASRTAAAT